LWRSDLTGVDFDHWVELDEDWEQQLPDWFNELVDVYVDAMRTAKAGL
jgi:hypothetical protein